MAADTPWLTVCARFMRRAQAAARPAVGRSLGLVPRRPPSAAADAAAARLTVAERLLHADTPASVTPASHSPRSALASHAHGRRRQRGPCEARRHRLRDPRQPRRRHRRQGRCRPRRPHRVAVRRIRCRWQCQARRYRRPRRSSAAEHQRHGVIDGRLIAAKACRELGEQRRADADDDGQHQDLDARRDHVAEHALGGKGGLAEQPERDQHEAGQRRQLELDQGDKELDRQR